jgi:hypothetical protein
LSGAPVTGLLACAFCAGEAGPVMQYNPRCGTEAATVHIQLQGFAGSKGSLSAII